jgi:hypothetical protein
MAVIEEFRTPADYWAKMVEPDYQDCLDRPDDLRAAFHAAISLFHFHDWIWTTHEQTCRSFTFVDGTGAKVNVHNAETFANALEQQCEDFGRIRGIANAAKHLQLRNIRPVKNAPSHAGNTATTSTEYGQGAFGAGPFGGTARVMLEGPNGQHMEFSDVARSVHAMWEGLRATYKW